MKMKMAIVLFSDDSVQLLKFESRCCAFYSLRWCQLNDLNNELKLPINSFFLMLIRACRVCDYRIEQATCIGHKIIDTIVAEGKATDMRQATTLKNK